jgi:hypothetical protein
MRPLLLDFLPVRSEEEVLSVIREGRNLKAGWRDLLGRDKWTEFGTLTFPTEIQNPIRCIEEFRGFLARWERKVAIEKGLARYIRSPKKKLVGVWVNQRNKKRAVSFPTWFAAIEPHQSGKSHIHFVLRPSVILGTMCESYGQSVWKQLTHGGSIINQELRDPTAASGYTTKHIICQGHFFVSDNFPK